MHFLFLDPLLLLIHWLLPIQMSMHGRNADAGGVKKGWGRYGLERWPWIVAKITRHCRQFISSSAAHALLSLLRDQCRHSLPHEKLNATVLTRSHESFLYASYNWTRNKEFSLQKKKLQLNMRKILARKYGRGVGAVFAVLQICNKSVPPSSVVPWRKTHPDLCLKATWLRVWYSGDESETD